MTAAWRRCGRHIAAVLAFDLRVLELGDWIWFATIVADDPSDAYLRALRLIPPEHRDKPIGIQRRDDEWHSKSRGGPPPN